MRVSILIFICTVVFSTNAQNFGNLNKLKINNSDKEFLMYNASCSYVFNTALGELDREDPFYPKEDVSFGDIKLIKTKIDKNSDVEFYIVFSENPSGDPHFMFFRDGEYVNFDISIPGFSLYIPGDGTIYVSGHINNDFDTRKKYIFKDNKIVEVEQPFYYVGIKSKTLQKVKLYDSPDLTRIIAVLEPNSPVQILLNRKDTHLYLISTEFGITGWIDNGFGGLQPTILDGIFHAGD